MATVKEWVKIDAACVLEGLDAARAKLCAGETELVLDFSSVQRLDSAALTRLSALASIAAEKSASIGMRNVNVDVYRVLKTAQVASRFHFCG